jgi:RHS repeat-associated protein
VELRQYHGPTPTPHTPGSWDATTYTFDRRGFQTKVADPLGNGWAYEYDVRGRQVVVKDPDRGRSTFTYDNAGRVLTSTDARGKKIAYLYDTLGRKRAVYDNQVGGTMRAQWIYDTVAKGQLSQSTRFVGSAGYQTKVIDYTDDYLPGNAQIIIPDSETGLAGTYNYTNTYNLDGSVKSTRVPGTNTDLQPETLTYGYDKLGLPTTIDSLYGSVNQPYVVGTDYNALGELDQVKLHTGTGDGNRVYTRFSRELETGRLTGIRTDRDSVAPYIQAETSYKYDDAGNITKITDSAPEVDDTQCFSYDYLRRLAQAWTPASSDCGPAPSADALGGPAPYWHSWEIDKIGNRTKEVIHSVSGDAVTTYGYPAPGTSSVRPHALTTLSGARTGTYTYDDAGNTLTRPTSSAGTQTLTWDPEGHLASATDNTGTTSYIYDADGNRLIQRDPAGRTLYLPGQEIRYDNSAAITSCTRYYSYATGTIGSRTHSGLTWLSPDHQGTASVAITAANQEATTRRQVPFGAPRGTPAGSWPNNRGFVGGVMDNTGLTHLGAREYDPSIGKFISVDPLQDLADPQQWNAYAYANNTPITMSDPSGLAGDTGNGSGNGERFNPDSGNVTDPGKYAGHPTGGKKNHGNVYTGAGTSYSLSNGTTVSTDNNGRRTINGMVPRAGGPDIDALAAGVDRARGDYNLGMCYGECEYDTINWIFTACASKYVECSTGYTWNVQIDKMLSMCIDVGVCGWRDVGSGAFAFRARANHKKLRDQHRQESCYYNSFSADTKVLMADGAAKKFSQLKIGDKVLAADPETGERGPREIEAVWVHWDDLYRLTVDGNPVTTTEDHPFWNETDGAWQDAQDLDSGDQLRAPSGSAVVGVFDASERQYAEAYNLTVAGVHTYYVLAGSTPVLVHNCGGGVDAKGNPCSCAAQNPTNWNPNSRPTFGHTFSEHGAGARNTRSLTDRARSTGNDQGQWANNDDAAAWLRDQYVPSAGPRQVPLPAGMGSVIRPDGSVVSATHAQLVPGRNGLYKSAFPIAVG